jgi:hypothetical protein
MDVLKHKLQVDKFEKKSSEILMQDGPKCMQNVKITRGSPIRKCKRSL